jgi:CheY-like chemotaxis protein
VGLLAALLLPLGFDVLEAASGRECLEIVERQPPDAVLLDISMDDMDGWATARAIRGAGFSSLPIVMVSANVFENRPENLQAAQCQAFVGKPVMESELLRALGDTLGLRWRTRHGWVHGDLGSSVIAPINGGDANTAPPPSDAVWELSRLARKGHVQALRQSLKDWRQSHPELEAHWARIEAGIESFELDAIVNYLRPYVEEDASDEA